MHTPIIDYQKIADAKIWYESRGFLEIPVPWIINYESYNATRPAGLIKEFYTLDGYLNASGEQSFVHLALLGKTLSKHLCITACFRDEDLDETHHKYFMKLELIDTAVSIENLQNMIAAAQEFFNRYTQTKVIPTNVNGETFDIVDTVHGIELGSYGIRRYKDFSWIYGTGVALPRLDTVINKIHN